jgi:uncharacterized membrane protein
MDYQQPPQEPPQSSSDQQQPGAQNLGPKTSMGLDPNIAAALSYLCGWLTGLVFFLAEKDNNFVRFHALQSIITFGALTVLSIGLTIVGMLPIPGTGVLSFVGHIGIMIIGFVAWVILMIKGYQGERFHFPIVGDIAEKNMNKVG